PGAARRAPSAVVSRPAGPARLRWRRSVRREEPTMRIFVAGATGALGRRLLPLLIDRGHQVTAMTRRPAGAGGRRAVRGGPGGAGAPGREGALAPRPPDR